MTQNTIALITGGSRGLGRTAVALPLDTADVSSCAAFAAFAAFAETLRGTLSGTWGREGFDALVNNAGIGGAAPFAEITEELFDDLYAVHVKGVFFLTQALLPLLADGGSILNYSSGLTRFSTPGQAAYASAKGAVEVLTRYLAVELGSRGIRVNTIAPGPIATDFQGGALTSDQARAFLGSQTALGRIGEPEDVGQAVAALVSGHAHWINAQRVEVSGGTLL